jgi:trans-2,3-dihydro-3-hydroxyanthranilate isomerase
MPRLRYVRCDVFSSKPFGGNPLAVFTDGRGLDDATMQAIAREMNLSETVFILPAQAQGLARIRIFTPRVELDFAGHPTIGAAFVLSRPLQTDRLVLEAGVGAIEARVDREGANPRSVWLDLPLPEATPEPESASLLRALGLSGAATPIVRYRYGITHIVVQINDVAQLSGLTPDYAALAQFGPVGIVVFVAEGPSVRARVFVPGAGVPEDPATGSAVAPIALHLYHHAPSPIGSTITIHQGVELARPSELLAKLQFEANDLARIWIGGECVLLGRGEMHWSGQAAD